MVLEFAIVPSGREYTEVSHRFAVVGTKIYKSMFLTCRYFRFVLVLPATRTLLEPENGAVENHETTQRRDPFFESIPLVPCNIKDRMIARVERKTTMVLWTKKRLERHTNCEKIFASDNPKAPR